MAGSLGGRARIRLYGNPGTAEGRKLGGSRSLKTHAYLGTRFVTLRQIRTPARCERFAELMGILAGDGHLGVYQTSVTTSSITDIEHAEYVRTLLRTLFRIPVSITKIKRCNALVVLMSSKAASDFLRKEGMVRGNKVKAQIRPPRWILMNPDFRNAYLRGLIDTDGTAYFDRHRVKGKDYASMCLAFTNASTPLLDFVEDSLKELGFHPSRWGRHVRLRRRKEVLEYVKIVGFSNPKHARRIGV